MTAIALSTLGGGIDHPEGICWDPAGYVVVGTEAGQVLWLDATDGSVRRSASVGTGLLTGLAIDGDGRVYACDVPQGRVARIDADGTVETFTTGPVDRPLVAPNYPVLDATGRLFVSASGVWGSGNGQVVVVDVDGRASTFSAEPSAFTNGMALSPDGRYLYVVESSLPGVSRLPILEDGSAGTRELVVEMPRTVPDGIAFTEEGLLLIACYRPDSVLTWDGAALALLVEDWTGLALSAPTNLAFAGARHDRLLSSNLAGWHVTEIGAGMVGAPLHHPRRP